MPTVSTRVGQLHVEIEGSGPPAVVWHSLFVDATTWGRLRPALASVRTLILIDGPGHGRSSAAPGPYTLSDCALAVVEILAALDVSGPVDWLGNAWGGHVGVFFAAEHPAACRSLVTIASPINALAPADRRSVQLLRTLHRLVGPRPVAGIPADVLLGKALRRQDPAAAAVVRSSFIRADRAGMRQAIGSISLDRPDATDRLTEISAPTLMATGADDPMCPPADVAGWVARMPAGRDLVLPGAGHLAPLFDPATADVITDFWKRADR
ncbi:pimeloyl-ACP methyl ester carboxylesterase [Asanoa ferruginea]|uniref:Pimeloyl-ACP methyl ester carboxylesterase n=1 Tax=Asanoa ferruginea TaxID=53367 RepID=A0A3D9ZNJ5_9ACTN|nr:alpha/beta fold hydrolase [Asanoa ferruginea]REF95210.1 pimeloyl-ACP methyl ester carboxylesterase [Asanoa ferruginea]GIF52804.1 putative hydrolase, alpha/beta fold protein [Asanoa ferruginea]